MFSILVALRASSLLMMFKHARINQQNNHKTLYCHVGTIIIATRRKVGLSLQQRKKNLFWSYWLLLACQMTLWCTFTIMTPFLPSSSSTLMGDASLTSTQKQLLGKGGIFCPKRVPKNLEELITRYQRWGIARKEHWGKNAGTVRCRFFWID